MRACRSRQLLRPASSVYTWPPETARRPSSTGGRLRSQVASSGPSRRARCRPIARRSCVPSRRRGGSQARMTQWGEQAEHQAEVVAPTPRRAPDGRPTLPQHVVDVPVLDAQRVCWQRTPSAQATIGCRVRRRHRLASRLGGPWAVPPIDRQHRRKELKGSANRVENPQSLTSWWRISARTRCSAPSQHLGRSSPARGSHHDHRCGHRPGLRRPAVGRRIRQARRTIGFDIVADKVGQVPCRHRPVARDPDDARWRWPCTPSTPATRRCWPRPTSSSSPCRRRWTRPTSPTSAR